MLTLYKFKNFNEIHLSLLYFNENMSNVFNLSSYSKLLRPLTIFVAIFCTLSSVLCRCDEKGVLLQNIVGSEYIVCTHWLNIVGAAAPTAPMIPAPMYVRFDSSRVVSTRLT